MSMQEFFKSCRNIASDDKNVTTLIVPNIEWSLSIVVVPDEDWDEMFENTYKNHNYIHVSVERNDAIFAIEDKTTVRLNGAPVCRGSPEIPKLHPPGYRMNMFLSTNIHLEQDMAHARGVLVLTV